MLSCSFSQMSMLVDLRIWPTTELILKDCVTWILTRSRPFSHRVITYSWQSECKFGLSWGDIRLQACGYPKVQRYSMLSNWRLVGMFFWDWYCDCCSILCGLHVDSLSNTRERDRCECDAHPAPHYGKRPSVGSTTVVGAQAVISCLLPATAVIM